MGPSVAVRRVVLAGLIALLAGCGSEKPEASPIAIAVGTVAKSAIGRLSGRKAAPAAAPSPVTSEAIESYGIPILRAVIATRSADALLTIGDAKGDVVTWATTDGTTFTLRDGVLIQTRGLGADLMSAKAPTVAELLQDGGTHERQYYFLGANDLTTRRTYTCTVSLGGQETIRIFDRAHEVTRVAETCARPQGSITNDFWIEDGVIRKSRQLASGPVGFIEFERVVD